jgi:WD40 repeat protein
MFFFSPDAKFNNFYFLHFSFFLFCYYFFLKRQLFCATGDPVCTQFDLNTEKHVQSFEGHDEYLLSVCVQSNILTTGSCDGTIKIWGN